MPVTAGSTITAAFYNQIQTQVANILGVGSSNRGYGQASLIQSAQVAAGSNITATQWANLKSDLDLINLHQAGANTALTALSGAITAAGVNAYETQASNADANRLTAAAANFTLSATALTITRATVWGTSAIPSITGICTVSCASNDAARHFFNTGGDIRILMAHTSTATTQDSDWTSTLTDKVGTVTFRHGSTIRSGTAGTAAASIGFHNLTTTDQVIYNGTDIGGGAYASNDVIISARLNAVSGTSIIFTVLLRDDHTNSFYDSVASGTNVKFSQNRATGNGFTIAAPTFTQTQSF